MMWLRPSSLSERLFRRVRRPHAIKLLSRAVQRRVFEECRAVEQEERYVADLLGLPFIVRLMLVDEETVSVLRAGDRHILQEDVESQGLAPQSTNREEGGGRVSRR